MAANGKIAASGLSLIQDGLYLSTKTARAFKRLQAAAKKDLGRSIAAARVAGAYRSFAVQKAIQEAWDSKDRARMLAWNMDLSSTVRPADPGKSNHGFGVAVDIVGTDIDREFQILARRFGFSFPYGGGDPRHALHDGKTATSPLVPVKTVKHQTYVVQHGDTLSGIAAKYRTTWQHLVQLNPSKVEDPNRIQVGWRIVVT